MLSREFITRVTAQLGAWAGLYHHTRGRPSKCCVSCANTHVGGVMYLQCCQNITCGNCLASTSGGRPTSPHVKQCSLKSLSREIYERA